MILLDTEGNVYTDEGMPISQSMLDAVRASGACLIRHPKMFVLYRWGVDGDLTVYSVVGPKYKGIHLSAPDIAFFNKLGQVTNNDAHLLDIGGGLVRVYLDKDTFDFPLELMTHG